MDGPWSTTGSCEQGHESPQMVGAFLQTGLSTLYSVWTPLAKFGLHAGNTKFNT